MRINMVFNLDSCEELEQLTKSLSLADDLIYVGRLKQKKEDLLKECSDLSIQITDMRKQLGKDKPVEVKEQARAMPLLTGTSSAPQLIQEARSG